MQDNPAKPGLTRHFVRNVPPDASLGNWLKHALDNSLSEVVSFGPDGPGPKSSFTARVNWSRVGTVARFRRSCRRELAARETPACSIYHNGWGLDLLANLDRAPKRLVGLHQPLPALQTFIAHYIRYSQGVVSYDRGILGSVREKFPWIPERFTHWIPLAVAPPEAVSSTRAQPRPELRIGFHGEMRRRRLRIDRIPEFLNAMDSADVDFRFEILGDGPDRDWLLGIVGGHPRVKVWDTAAVDEPWEILKNWRYALNVSDYEGVSTPVLNCYAAGVPVLMPDFEMPDSVPEELHPELIYPFGEPWIIARKIAEPSFFSGEARERFLRRSAEYLEHHKPETVLKRLRALPETVAAQRTLRTRTRSGSPFFFPMLYYQLFYNMLTFGRLRSGLF